jgi:hypothetical protein
MRPLPPEAAGIGSSFDLPVVSSWGHLQPKNMQAFQYHLSFLLLLLLLLLLH